MDHKPTRKNPIAIARQMMGRNALFLLFIFLSILLFLAPLKLLVKSSLRNELYSHIILIPLVSIYLIYTLRGTIFQESSFSIIPGSVFIFTGVVFYLVGRGSRAGLDQNHFLSMMTFAAVVSWIGGFLLFYGIEASRIALFPLLFLFFMVPVPSFLMERIILFLQVCSAEVSFWFFK